MGCGASNAAAVSKQSDVKSSITELGSDQAPKVTPEIKVFTEVPNGDVAINVDSHHNQPQQISKLRKLSSIHETEDGSETQATSKSPTTSKGIQTEAENASCFKSVSIQTDSPPFPEDELELLIDGNGGYFQAFNTPDTEKDVNHQDVDAQESNNLYEESSLISSEKMPSGIHIDVGIQVKIRKISSSTQTRLAIAQHRIQNNEEVEKPHLWFPDAKEHQWNNLQQSADIRRESLTQLQDFESQTDPISEILAANGAAGDVNVLHSYNVSSPFSHIGRELSVAENHKKKKQFDVKLQECLNKLLDDIEDSVFPPKQVIKKDTAMQTDNDPLTDEAPEYAARPPPTRKKEMVPSLTLFRDVDNRALKAPENVENSVVSLVNYLCDSITNDLFKVRAIFRWITDKIRYEWKCMGVTCTSTDILKTQEGVCKDYCQLFSDLCSEAGLRVKKVRGFAKGHDYRPGHHFKPGEDIIHIWNAVYILGSWRLVDPTWGTGYTDHSGKFQKQLNEHFFLTDPESLIWTHFPYDDLEANYSRWQLLDKPLTLDEFNSLAKVTPFFFEFNLKIRTKLQNPIVFKVQTEIKIGAHEPMRYKYKLYPSDEVENSSLNHYVFCQLKEDRLVGSFLVVPPVEGRYYLKIYAKPERHVQEKQFDASPLHPVATFLLECTRARKYIEPYPLNELPWGPTQAFYDYRMKLHNQIGPVISTWGGKRRLVIEYSEAMLITYQVMDSDGMEMDAKNLVLRDDSGNKTTFTISFPRVGMFKFMIFGMPKPKQRGKWRLPLLATFLIDCKLAKLPPQDEDPPPERTSEHSARTVKTKS